ncbi:hypothetical protein BAE30_16410 [Acidithiobacillus caldus]|uniref:Uncharacterized protein n=1 Tax=Acidithiobacillus caldus TaxID=33059 RepID=A0A1E7YS36_9PROT|nr:hypothetical protein BAE30_16410 [Acidithiobacillus caldus]
MHQAKILILPYVFSVIEQRNESQPWLHHLEVTQVLNLPMAKTRGFPFSLRCGKRRSLAYRVWGRFMRPAPWNLKDQRAAQPIPIPDIHRGVGIGVRLMSTPGADVGMFMTFV